jgi:hypothetical protein
MKINTTRLNKYLGLALLCAASLAASCLSHPETMPNYPKIPAGYAPSDMAQIRLVTANKDGFAAPFSQKDWGCTFLMVPYKAPEGSAAVSFDDACIVYIDSSWETRETKKGYWFNDRAVFNVPAGEYNVCIHKLVTAAGHKHFESCLTDRTVEFKRGGKYELFIYYEVELKREPGRIVYTHYFSTPLIRQTDEFLPNAEYKKIVDMLDFK